LSGIADFQTRDFRGYGADPPDPAWPGEARVAVSVVINVEEGSERSIRRGDAANEPIYDMLADIPADPDPVMESHFDFGPRVGYWRLMRILEEFGIEATLSACGETAAHYPWLFRDAAARGHEVACHGWRREPHVGLAEEAERQRIARTVEALGQAAGTPPVGWHTRTPPSVNTRRLLLEHGGFLYDSDAYDDELPRLIRGPNGPHVIMPYSLDTNDMRCQLPNGFRHAGDFARYLIDAYDWLHQEGERWPRMMSIGLHLRIITRPGRIGGLVEALAHIQRRGSAWFARRDRIARHWLERFG
jgi:peptidoglycan/xylan/chitin deacetylase (PgdA/CDA1 family)